jgi:hypothetical protein
MRGHNDIILAVPDEPGQRSGIEAVIEAPDGTENRLKPLLVSQGEEDRPELGELAHHELVTLAIGLTEKGAGIGERIDDVSGDPAALEAVENSFSGLAVPRAGGGVKDQDLL